MLALGAGAAAPLAWVNAQARPLTPAATSDADLGFLDAVLRGASLGEASHGTHEFYLTKLRLVRYLVTHRPNYAVGPQRAPGERHDHNRLPGHGLLPVLAKGQLVAKSFTAQPTSLSALLAQAKYPSSFLPLANVVQPFKIANQTITNINTNWTTQRELPIRLGVDFDGLIFLRHTTASLPLK